MELRLNDEWYIRTDKLNFVLCRKVKLKDGIERKDKRKKYREDVIGYYGSFSSALESYPNYRVRYSKRTSLRKIVDLMREVKEEVVQLKDQLDELGREIRKEQK